MVIIELEQREECVAVWDYGQEEYLDVKVSEKPVTCRYLKYTTLVVDCGSPGDFPNGIVIVPRTTFEGVATFFCDRDFRRVGDRRRVCQADGTWTGSVPICIG